MVRASHQTTQGENIMEVGFIGLGNMGTGIAKSLLRSGHKVAAYNRTRGKAEALASNSSGNATIAASIAEACRPGIVFTMMADDHAVSETAFSANGILASLPSGGTHISCSTISVALADKLAAEHAKAGQHFVSAPVFGRPDAAEAAQAGHRGRRRKIRSRALQAALRSDGHRNCSSSAKHPHKPTSSSSPAIS